MIRLFLAPLFVLGFVVSSSGQAYPAGKQSTTLWTLNADTGSDAGLGFKLPHLALGVSFERPIGKRFELLGGVSYSPDRKYITNDGNSFSMSATSLFWINGRFAVSGTLYQSFLWTSQFNKRAWAPAPGIVIRDNFGAPGRLYIDYVLPTGCQWGASCPIQSNRLQGPEFEWEHLLWPRFALGFHLGFYRVLNQANPLDRAAGRTGEWTGDSYLVMRYEFHSRDLESPY
jgi:hypothetical protein